MSSHSARTRAIGSLLALLIISPVLYDATTPFRTLLGSYNAVHPFATFEVYEYDAAMWIRARIPHESIVLSDPYTINLMTELSGLQAPYTRRWVEQVEYSKADLTLMQQIRTEVFLTLNIDDRMNFVNEILAAAHAPAAIIILNGRTLQWLASSQIILTTFSGIPTLVSSLDVLRFSLEFRVNPVYELRDKISVFEIPYNSLNFQEANATPIADDQQALRDLWKVEADGNGTIGAPLLADDPLTKVIGVDSLKITSTSGTSANWRIYRSYVSESLGLQDWSNKNFLLFYWYGTNSNKTLRVILATNGDNWSNAYRYELVENWSGWKRVVIALGVPTDILGSPNTTFVSRVGLTVTNNALGTRWLDHVAVDSQ